MFNEYPYTDFHEMNLDWILKKMKEMSASIDNIPNLIDKLLSDKGLQEIISQYINELREQIADANEELNTASASRSVGELVFVQGKLYRVTKEMTAGDRYIDGGNCVKTTVEDLIYLILTSVTNLIEPNSKIASADRTVNDFVWLNGKLVKIIAPIKKGATYDVNNYVEFNVNDFYREYSSLNVKIDNEITERKSLIVNDENDAKIQKILRYGTKSRINDYFSEINAKDVNGDDYSLLVKGDELEKLNTSYICTPEEYGAVGDGVSDDSEAILTACNPTLNGGRRLVVFSKKYNMNNNDINLDSTISLYGSARNGLLNCTLTLHVGSLINGLSIINTNKDCIKIIGSENTIMGCYLESNGFGVVISNETFEQATQGNRLISIFANTNNGVYLKNTIDCYITNCFFTSSTFTSIVHGNGIQVEGRVEALCVSDSEFISYAFAIFTASGSLRYSSFTGAYFDNSSNNNCYISSNCYIITFTGCWFSSRGGYGLYIVGAQNITVNGCKFTNNNGIGAIGIGTGSGYINITNNILGTNNKRTVYGEGSNVSVNGLVFTGNMINIENPLVTDVIANISSLKGIVKDNILKTGLSIGVTATSDLIVGDNITVV